jgi:hypothetical protein
MVKINEYQKQPSWEIFPKKIEETPKGQQTQAKPTKLPVDEVELTPKTKASVTEDNLVATYWG